MIVDSSALIEIVNEQPLADQCERSLVLADSASISAANLLETFMVIERPRDPRGRQVFERLMDRFAIQVEPVTESQVYLAREAFVRFGRGRHPAKLNFGDCFAYALSRETGEPLLFVGNDFGQTDIGVA